jgi:hypothetical protein
MLAIAPQSPSGTVQDVIALLNDVDFSMVKRKLMDEDEGQGWTQEYVDAVEIRYRRYLCMLFMNPNGSIVPTRDIDLFWHHHILDTRAYALDCQNVFGYFVHHFPYFGMRDEEDAKDLLSSFESTKIYYKSLFDEDYVTESEDSDSSACHKGPGNCHKCKSGCGMQCKTCKSK